ncbi:hypothetical protein OHA70_38040 [Kribbella sp. NBC_00382]|uniref:hypothetical protein n=1 Tax=Kribbella sp. NBC_00382 TaxID=2975967 RepID=UPI002E1B1F88
MDQTKAPAPAQKPAKGPAKGPAKDPAKDYAWHRHPALIATIPVIGALIGSVLTIVAGQNGKLPESINPAPPPTTVVAHETTTATVTATETTTQTVTPSPTEETSSPDSSTSSSVGVPPPGTLAITVLMTTNGKIGPNEYRAGSAPTAYARVNDESGQQLGKGCYPTWVVKRGSTTVQSVRGESCGSGIDISRDSLKVRGLYHVTISVTTDAGPKATKTLDFQVT